MVMKNRNQLSVVQVFRKSIFILDPKVSNEQLFFNKRNTRCMYYVTHWYIVTSYNKNAWCLEHFFLLFLLHNWNIWRMQFHSNTIEAQSRLLNFLCKVFKESTNRNKQINDFFFSSLLLSFLCMKGNSVMANWIIT